MHLLTYFFEYYLLCCLTESSLDILVRFGWSLKEKGQILIFPKFFGLLNRHFSSKKLICKITKFIYLFAPQSERILRPGYSSILLRHTRTLVTKKMINWQIDKKVLCNIVYQKDSCWASVEGFYDWTERLLTGSVPDLHLYRSVLVDAYYLGIKLYSKCSSISLSVCVFGKSI